VATLTLTGTNTYSGVTSNLAGTLLVNGILSGSPVVQVRPGSTLGGTGQVQSVSVFTSGQVSPGSSPGNLTAAGSVLLSSGALSIELNGLTPGTGYDRLTTGGTVTLGGTLNLSLGFTPVPGDSFTILNKTSVGPISGTFAGLAEGASFAAGGLLFQITYVGGNGNDAVLTRAAAPASDINSITPVTSERMQILGQGLPFVNYILEASTNLNAPIPWLPVATNSANALGVYEFIDAYTDNGLILFPARFYRVQSL
jgi:fibronectin-binding autotransporter adhesin